MRIVPRAEWGARAPTHRTLMPLPSPRLWLHHTASDGASWHGPGGVRNTQNYHMDSNGWSDIAYSYLVDDDGTVYEGRGAGVVGAHTEGDNSSSHAICAMGNYQERKPPSPLLLGISDLLIYGHQHGWWPATITGGHQNAPGAQTACPGCYLMDALPGLNQGVPPTSSYVGDALMPAAKNDTDAQHAMIREWFWRYLGRGLNSMSELEMHTLVFARDGADPCLSGITDSPEASWFRERRGW